MKPCEFCGQVMLESSGCTNSTVEFPDGTKLNSIRSYRESICHDCNASQGSFHHPGCDMEVCPRCGGQLISCGCLDDPNDLDDDDVFGPFPQISPEG